MVSATGWWPMFKSKLFARYFLLAASFSFACFILFLIAAQSLNKDSFTDIPGQGQMRKLTSFLNTVTPNERVKYLEENSSSPQGMRPFEILFCDEKGNILYPRDHIQEKIDLSKESGRSMFSFLFSKESIKQIEALDGEPKQFLVFSIDLDNTHSQITNKRQKFLSLLGGLFLAMTIGVFAGLLLIFSLLRGRAKHLDFVINELHHGNLKARLPLGKMDEIGLMMSRFNEMADEIENLVNSLRKAETTRKELLRELAHDLRTPIASLKNLLEMSYEKKHLLSEEKKDELLITSLSEIEYFSSLVDDLLFLGQIQDPKYKTEKQLVSFSEIAQEEINHIKPRFPEISVDLFTNIEKLEFYADEQLMRRLFRNLLENSFSFAKEKISLTLFGDNQSLNISITDDGQGFSKESLENFGHKKAKRFITENKNRISIGLGSVIMRSIVESYSGTIIPKNILSSTDETLGAKIEAKLLF